MVEIQVSILREMIMVDHDDLMAGEYFREESSDFGQYYVREVMAIDIVVNGEETIWIQGLQLQ